MALDSASLSDGWTRLVGPPLQAFLKGIKEPKVNDRKTFDVEATVSLVGKFTAILEGQHSAFIRALMVQSQSLAPGHSSGMPAQP
jgi:hypothetical protein